MPIPEKQPNFLWIVIDSLRGDVLGRYGVSPVLDHFSEKAYVFENHYVNAAWTRPSTLVFFTGKYASRNPVNFWDYPTPKNEAMAFYEKEMYPLPKYLSQNGVRTVMVGNNPFLTDKNGLGVDVGFEELFDFSDYINDTPYITKKSLLVIDELAKTKKPFFFFLNYNDPHKPYTPPSGYTQRIQTTEILEERKRDYLGEVGYIDDQLGIIFERLKQNNLWDNTVILITADHGEVMQPEHAISPFTGTNTYFGHGQDLFLENIHVPLLVKLSEQKTGRKFKARTQSVDLYPFVLDTFHIKANSKLDGVSLNEVVQGKSNPNRLYYGETRSTQAVGLGNDFLLQKSYRFHELGKFWEGFVGREVYYYYDITRDRLQVTPIRFNDLAELEERNLKSDVLKKITNLYHQLRDVEPSLPIYVIRINPQNTGRRTLQIKANVSYGQIRIQKKPENVSVKVESSDRQVTLSLDSTQLDPKAVFEIAMEVYPDVSFPVFHFLEDGIDVTNTSVGIGMFDLAPNSCSANCLRLYDAQVAKPKISTFNRFQVWQSGGFIDSYVRDNHLETDAMEILKKQGYVQ